MTTIGIVLCCFGFACLVLAMLVLDMALNRMASNSDERLDKIDEEQHRQRG